MFSATADVYDALYSFRDHAAEVAQLRRLVPAARSWLDVGCATGSHLSALQPHVPRIAGVELDDALIAAARRRLTAGVTLWCGDMCETDLGERFDVVSCLYASVAYVVTAERLALAVARMAAHLDVGGVLLLEPWYRSVARCPRVQVRHVDTPELKIARLSRTTIDAGVASIDVRYLIGRADGIESRRETHQVGIFSDAEYRAAMHSAGLVVDDAGEDRYIARKV